MRKIGFYKHVSFGVSVVLVTLLFMSCNNKTSKTEAKPQNIVTIAGVVNFTYPDSLQVNTDIPFSLLVDKEYKKQLPDTFNYEVYRPAALFLSVNFDVEDSVSLESFPSITIELVNPHEESVISLNDDLKKYLIESINKNLSSTSYKIGEWKGVNTFLYKNTIDALEIAYSQTNADNKKLNIDNRYYFSKGKVFKITLTSPDSTYDEWKKYFDTIVNSAVFVK